MFETNVLLEDYCGVENDYIDASPLMYGQNVEIGCLRTRTHLIHCQYQTRKEDSPSSLNGVSFEQCGPVETSLSLQLAGINDALPLDLQFSVVFVDTVVLHHDLSRFIDSTSLNEPSWRLRQRYHQDGNWRGESDLRCDRETPSQNTSSIAQAKIVEVSNRDANCNKQELY